MSLTVSPLRSTHSLRLLVKRLLINSDHCCVSDEPLWATSDPFDICADPTASGEADEPHNDAKNLVEERRRKRQEAYRMRRELRKQQRQGVLVNGLDNDADVFSRPPR